MTDDAMRRVLDLVSEGRLSIEEAGPILDALDLRGPEPPDRAAALGSTDGAPARAVRIEVSERGRSVVNLRVPIALGRAAVERIPGLSESVGERIREALSNGYKGSIVEIDDDGDGVRIVIE